MATRPVFVPDQATLVKELAVEFEWFPGFAISQKQKSIEALHLAASAGRAETLRILEVSTKSTDRTGSQLSAFNLRVELPGTAQLILLEAAFQGSKVFSESGQHAYLYEIEEGREVKRRVKVYSEERVIGFRFGGHEWPTEPRTAFYDWLYLRALANPIAQSCDAREELVSFDAFTDIEFNPAKSVNCQARSCALFVALAASGQLDIADDPDEFVAFLRAHHYGAEPPRIESQRLF